MLIKALLPLIAVLKFKCDRYHGEMFGKEIATVYKACKEEIKPKTSDSTVKSAA